VPLVRAMSRGKGLAAPAWVAQWLRPWWPAAEKTPNSRPGRDLLGTPGVAIEVKTSSEWRPLAWMKQAARYPQPGEVALLVYLPRGFGAMAVGDAMAIMRLRELMPLLVAAGYAPAPTNDQEVT
jgi:hypothetical protein